MTARILLISLWIFAIGGSTFSACSDLNSPFTTNIELIIFVAMGLSIFLIWNELIKSLVYPALVLG